MKRRGEENEGGKIAVAGGRDKGRSTPVYRFKEIKELKGSRRLLHNSKHSRTVK